MPGISNDSLNALNANDGNPLFDFHANQKWSIIELAQRIVADDPQFYTATGGDLSLFPQPSTVDTGLQPQLQGPNEQKATDDIVAHFSPWVLSHPAETQAEMVSLNYVVPRQNPDPNIPPTFYWSPYYDQQAVEAGFTAGASVEDAISALVQQGYPVPFACDLIYKIFSNYQACIGNASLSRFQVAALQPSFLNDYKGALLADPEVRQFIHESDGYIVSAVTTNMDAIGEEFVYTPFTTETAIRISQNVVKNLNYPWVTVVKRRMGIISSFAPGLNPLPPHADCSGGGIGYQYILNAYRLRHEDPQTSNGILLDLAAAPGASEAFITRFDAVKYDFEALTAKAVAAAKHYKIPFGLVDMISPSPIAPVDKMILSQSNLYNVAGLHFPVELVAFLLTAAAGYNPLDLTSKPGVIPINNGDWHGKVVNTVIGPQTFFDATVQSMLRAQIAYWTVAGGYLCVSMGAIRDLQGNVVKDAQGNSHPGKYASLIAFVKNPDGTRAFPYFEDNNYGDLAARLAAGDTTLVELANVYEGVLADPAMYQLLGAVRGSIGIQNKIDTTLLGYDADVAAAFYQNKNMVTIRNAWLTQTPKPAAAPTNTVSGHGTLLPWQTTDPGRYGSLNPQTA